jgi:hypothetical protein
MSRTDFGRFGRPLKTIALYEDWRDEVLELQEAAEGGDEEAGRELAEASPDGKADFATFLYGNVRVAFYTGYERAEMQWKRYAGKDEAVDFREKRIKGFNGMQGIGYVGDLGDRPGMRRSFRPEASIMVDTYGGEYKITRQALRNDDTNQLLSRTPGDMGYAAGIFIQQTIVALIVSNPTAPDGLPTYSTSRPTNGGVAGNASTAFLSEDSLLDGVVWMQTQRDDDNRPIVVKANLLVVQNDRMAAIARRSLNSQVTGIREELSGLGAGAMGVGTNNPLAEGGMLPGGVVVDNFFPDPHDWYLFADPDQLPAFTMSFLDGEETPFVGMREPHIRSVNGSMMDPYSWDLRSLDFITEFDFGAAPVETRATYRSVVA